MLASVVLACLVLSAGFSAQLGGRGVVLLAAMSLLWLLVNGPMEGAVLVKVSKQHGFTAADLAGVAGLGLAAYRGLEWRRRRRPSAGD